MRLKPRHVFLKIEPLARYSPLAPILCSRHYGRDCMFNHGHELGRVSADEIAATSLDALVYHEYLDPHLLDSEDGPSSSRPTSTSRRGTGASPARSSTRGPASVSTSTSSTVTRTGATASTSTASSTGSSPTAPGRSAIARTDGSRSDEILPGERWTYVYDVTEETIGAWPFHDHAHDVGANIDRGLFGGLIVRDPAAQRARTTRCRCSSISFRASACSSTFKSTTIAPGQTWPPSAAAGIDRADGRRRVPLPLPDPRPDDVGHAVRSRQALLPNRRRLDPEQPVHCRRTRPSRPGGTVSWTNTESEDNHNHIVIADGGGAATFCLNGRTFVGNTPTDRGRRRRQPALVPLQPRRRRRSGTTSIRIRRAGGSRHRPGRRPTCTPQPGRVVRHGHRGAAGPAASRASSKSCSASRPTTRAGCA